MASILSILSRSLACATQVSRRLLVYRGHITGTNFAAVTAHYSSGVLKDGEDPSEIKRSEWEKRLSSEQFHITREKGTEIPFTGEYVHHYDKGIYVCVCCGTPLFSSETKFDSGSGWPSFYDALVSEEGSSDTNVLLRSDSSYGMNRVEVLCRNCDAHLGHVFPDGPRPTGQRYCINSASLNFEEKQS